MEVRLEHTLDAQPLGAGVVEVLLDVTLRVDHDRPTGRLVADHVAEQRQARQRVLAEEHHREATTVAPPQGRTRRPPMSTFGSVRATTDPPNPPPVIRAPCTPGVATSRSTRASTPGVDTSK